VCSSFQFTHRIGEVLLPGLIIDTLPQYLALCTLTAFLCLFKEYLVNYRIQLSRTSRARRKLTSAPSLSSPSAAVSKGEHVEDNEHTLPLMSPASSRPLHSPNTTASSALAAYYPPLLYGANMLLAYIVMLLVMSYNVGVIAVIVVASAVGHFYFTKADESEDGRRAWARDGRDGGRPSSASRAKQQLMSRRGQTDKSGERMELTVEDDPHNEEEWLSKDCCEQ